MDSIRNPRYKKNTHSTRSLDEATAVVTIPMIIQQLLRLVQALAQWIPLAISIQNSMFTTFKLIMNIITLPVDCMES